MLTEVTGTVAQLCYTNKSGGMKSSRCLYVVLWSQALQTPKPVPRVASVNYALQK